MPDSDFWILDSQKCKVGLGVTAGVFIKFGGPTGPWSLPSGRGSVLFMSLAQLTALSTNATLDCGEIDN
jgi:hypothetical protein